MIRSASLLASLPLFACASAPSSDLVAGQPLMLLAAEPVAEEVPAAEGPGYEVLSGPRGVADDLKKLGHVSPTIEKKLNDLGIFHYWQIAGLGPDAAHKIGERDWHLYFCCLVSRLRVDDRGLH